MVVIVFNGGSVKLLILITIAFMAVFGGRICRAEGTEQDISDAALGQKFVGYYKLLESSTTKNNCAGVDPSGRYRFRFSNPYYSDNLREQQQIPLNQRDMVLALEIKVPATELYMIKEDLDWAPVFERPSFRGLNDGDNPDRQPGLDVRESSRIYKSSSNKDEIVATQQMNVVEPNGVEVRLQVATLSQELGLKAKKGEGLVPHLILFVKRIVHYQYFVVNYGPTGLIEKLTPVDDCYFIRN
jgi:hypothetical protein